MKNKFEIGTQINCTLNGAGIISKLTKSTGYYTIEFDNKKIKKGFKRDCDYTYGDGTNCHVARKQRSPLQEKYITKSDLIEYKKLIIWLLNNKVNYFNYINIKEVMTTILTHAENNKISCKTKRGIKGAITTATIRIGLENVESNLRRENGLSVLALTSSNTLLEAFMQHRLKVLS